MIQIKTKLRKWGNSFGVVVPQGLLNDQIKENDEVEVFITKKDVNVRKAFGELKDWKIDPQKIKDQIREEEAKDELLC